MSDTSAQPTILPCPRCQAPPRMSINGFAARRVFCPNGCYVVQGTVADWNDLAVSRKLLTDLRRIAKTCKEDTIANGDGPTSFELNWEPDHQYQALIIWHHHDGPISEEDAAGATPEEAIGHLAAQLKRSY